jgi:SAM-dependent methyltransferase
MQPSRASLVPTPPAGSAAHGDHVEQNRRVWDEAAHEYVEPGRRNWAGHEAWGIWGIPESEVRLLPDAEGKDVLEMGCGTAYVSAWLARRGGRCVGLDNSSAQLSTARMFQDEFDIHFPLIHADGEKVPLRDQTFDVIVSEYGAAIWCDPYKWIPEASRLLRPGGELMFLGNGTILAMCVREYESEGPATDRLLRSYFGMHRFEWPDDESIEFHLGYGDWIRLLRANDFEILDLVELRPHEDATTRYPFVDLEWARRWPSEEVWRARKHG